MQTAAAWNVDEQNYYFALVGTWWVCLQSRMYCNCRPTLYFQQVQSVLLLCVLHFLSCNFNIFNHQNLSFTHKSSLNNWMETEAQTCDVPYCQFEEGWVQYNQSICAALLFGQY